MGITVLMYHGIGDEVAAHAELRYTVAEQSFAAHLEVLAGHPVVSVDQLLEGRATPGSVVLTFDDGEETVATRALPLLAARGVPAALFLTTAWLGTPGYLDPETVRGLAARGWTIGAHGHTHRYLSDLDDRELREELETSRAILAAVLGSPPVHMSLPGGRGDSRVIAAVRAAGFRSLCTSVVGVNDVQPFPFALRRLAVLRGLGPDEVGALADGRRGLLWREQLRKGLLDGAKRVLGNARYQDLRGRVLTVRAALRHRRTRTAA